MKKIIFVIAFLIVIIRISDCARILAYMPTPSFSHEIPFKPLWKELSLRGHQVVVVTPNPVNDKTLTNLTEIDISFTHKLEEDFKLQLINNTDSIIEYIKVCINMLRTLMESQLSSPQVRKIIDNPKEHFDVVIIENRGPPMYGFGKRFNCPIITILCNEPSFMEYQRLGSPTHPIVYPNLQSAMSANPTLLERVVAFLMNQLQYVLEKFLVTPIMQETLDKHFGKEYVLRELQNLISLLIVNSNPVLNDIRPLNPTIVEIGGSIIRNPVKPLNKNVKTMLNDAKEGFIYISLGSSIGHKSIPEKTLQAILEAFQELPYIILWKFDTNNLENKPENVIITSWVSQQEVLEHPNLKLFITQGGRMSIQEAVFAGVPMVGMPFYVDQPRNIQNMVAKGAALSVNYKTLDKNDFRNVILEVINNPRYNERVMELSKLVKDEPMTGIERAVWWTEYVIRHNGTRHLRSPLLDIPWYQYYLLDVLGFITIAVSVTVYVSMILIRIIVKTFQHFFVSNKQIKLE